MTKTVGECMSSKLVYLAEGSRPSVAIEPMLELGLSAVPVLDDHHVPIGVITLRELIDRRDGPPEMQFPVKTIGTRVSIADAAKAMLEAGTHHLIVVDEHGAAVGMLSSLDLVRALTGAVPHHPEPVESFGKRG
jgi:CBS domain-containing protein